MSKAIESAPPVAKPKRVPKKTLREGALPTPGASSSRLQEWVRAEGERVVIVFEGRDAAGKGSTIKRVTEYLNPRVARIVALRRRPTASAPSGTSSATSSTCRPPARSCCSTASWYNRAGVERVMGFCTDGGVRPVPAPVPDLRAAAGRGRHPAAQVLVLGQRRRAGARGSSRGSTTRCGAGSCRRWTWSRSPGGRTTRGPRTRCSPTPTSPRRRGTSSRATTSAAPGST